MQIQLDAAELEVAVTLYLGNQGMNLKDKLLDFSFDGVCTMDISVDENAAPATPKPKQTRKKAAPKKVEPVLEEEVAVAEVVEALEEQVEIAPEVIEEEPEVEVVEEAPVVEEKPKNEKSIFA